jgi:hypothetical protein
MSRSTPLTNLPSSKNASGAYEEKENALVKEILQEIDTDKSQNTQAMEQQQMMEQQKMMEQQQMMEQHQAMMEQQAMLEHQQAMMEQQTMAEQQQRRQTSENVTQHLDEQVKMKEQMVENKIKPNDNTENKSMVEKIMNLVKTPAIVAVIAVLISIPALTNMLDNFINSKEALSKYATVIILLVKGLLAGGLYFGINKSL